MSQTGTAPRHLKTDIDRIIKYAPAELIGREAETALLNDAWQQAQSQAKPRPHVMTFVALGGEGKTSLVAKWAAELAAHDWPGCDSVFAWSFYSQGTREQNAASSDLFLAEALKFFGDEAMANSAQGAFDKGRRLAELVGAQSALLILDGVEPLQYAPTSPLAGELKDQGLAALLKGLASQNRGLCVVTTRYALPDLRAYWQTTAPSHDLPRLARAAGVQLLQTIGVKGGLRQNLPSDDGREQWSAQSDLDEAWDIAARGPMRLHMADIHLYRARLFGVGQVLNLPASGTGQVENLPHKYPWESAAADLAEAERLINECGYHRRDEELADAKRAILG